jgi:peptide deformylase
MTDTYDIIYHPDPVLRQVASPIDSITEDIKLQAEKMLKTVTQDDRSVGLAANQVNILNRMMIAEYNPGSWQYDNPDANKPEIIGTGAQRRGNPILMINPEIVKKSERHSVCMEGCMSLPNQFAAVERPADITVTYIDLNGEKHELELSGFDSHVVQHELDHLDGKLFIDYISRLKRSILERKLEKFKKSEGLL